LQRLHVGRRAHEAVSAELTVDTIGRIMFSTTFSRVLATIVATSAIVGAQVSIRVVSASISASAGSVTRRSNTTGTVSASDRDPQWGCSAAASALARVSGMTASIAVQATSSGVCGPPPWSFGMSASGNANLLIRISSPTPAAGSLTLRGTPNPFVTIDVGDDGRPEPWVSDIPIVVDSTGVDVRLACSASAVAPFVPGAATNASVQFVPGPTRIDTSLQPCQAELSGWLTRLSNGSVRIDVVAHRSVVTPYAFFVFALNTQHIVVPPLGCVLGVDLLIPVPVTVDAQGNASFSAILAGPLPVVTLHDQFLAAVVDGAGNQVWRTSNRLAMQFP
jgi:hypothetical protein